MVVAWTDTLPDQALSPTTSHGAAQLTRRQTWGSLFDNNCACAFRNQSPMGKTGKKIVDKMVRREKKLYILYIYIYVIILQIRSSIDPGIL